MGDYTALINRSNSKKTDDKHFLFVVRPQNSGDGDEGTMWEGGLGHIKKSIDRSMMVMQTKVTKEIARL